MLTAFIAMLASALKRISVLTVSVKPSCNCVCMQCVCVCGRARLARI